MSIEVPAWAFAAMAAVGGLAVAMAVGFMRATRQIPPAPPETDPVYEAAMAREREEIAAAEATLEVETRDLELALATPDPDDRSAELARLMNSRGR